MYKSVIEIRKDVNPSMLGSLAEVAESAFQNRAGRVRNTSQSPYCFSFEGSEKDYGCLELGMLALEERKDFLSCVKAWSWIDEEEPSENCDILAEMMTPVR